MQNSILEKAKVAEQDYMLQFLKKLKPHSKLIPEFLIHNICIFTTFS